MNLFKQIKSDTLMSLFIAFAIAITYLAALSIRYLDSIHQYLTDI